MIRIAVCDDEQHVLDEISQMTATYMSCLLYTSDAADE